MKPVLQALLLADHIYQDHSTGKKIIAGTFNKLSFSKKPPITQSEGQNSFQILGGMHAGSPYAYLSITDFQGEAKCMLRYIDLEEDKVLLQCEFTVTCQDPLETIEEVLPLPPLPVAKAGIHALEFLCNNEIIGALRIQVEEML